MKAIIMAAGKGKRLLSEKYNMPKVLREAAGKKLISYVLETLDNLPKEDIIIIVGYKKEQVIEFTGPLYKYASQDEQLGTGHAVSMAKDELENYDGKVLVLCGDMPLIKKETIQKLEEFDKVNNNDCTILSCTSEKYLPYGRIIRDQNGGFVDIIEEKDCTDEQKKIREVNISVYMFNSKKLFECLSSVKNNNAQGEYYLTDVPKHMLEKGYKVGVYSTYDDTEILGVNTMEDLELVESVIANKNK